MPNSKARQGIPICKAKGHTVCPQYITKKFIKLLSELVVTISVFHKRDWESDGLTTDMSAYRNALSPSPPTIFFWTSSVQSLNCAPLSLALGANMQFPIINLNCETVCATLKIHPCLRFITQSYFWDAYLTITTSTFNAVIRDIFRTAVVQIFIHLGWAT